MRTGVILGDEPKYTLSEVAQLLSVPPHRIAELWGILALALPDSDEVAFTDADAGALKMLISVGETDGIDVAMERAVARSLGQTMARLAEWQVGILHDIATKDESPLGVDTAIAQFVDPIEKLQEVVWRRHVLAESQRVFASDSGVRNATLAIGFADVVGYTSLSRGLDVDQLAEFLEAFESGAADVVSRHGGKVVKFIGDEVMFTADTPLAAARIGLEFAARQRSFDGHPELRVGIGYGEVLRQFGDVHGTVVNAAARLTSVARPGTVLGDRGLASALADVRGIEVTRLRTVAVRGFDHLQPWLVRATSES